eukprot:11976768-Ditylum_brightwellii.AAC.1
MARYYGIGAGQFPVDLGGDVDLDLTWSVWLEKRRAEDRSHMDPVMAFDIKWKTRKIVANVDYDTPTRIR